MNQIPDTFDKQDFISNLSNAKELLPRAEKLASELVKKGYANIIFVGCGAPYRMMNLIKFWVDLIVKETIVKNFLPAEFVAIDPQSVDHQTVVIFGSYSGTTKETVEAAQFCGTKDCLRIGITRFDDSPLSQQVDISLNFGDANLGDYSRFMVATAFINRFLTDLVPRQWTQFDQIKLALSNLPQVLATTVEQNEIKIRQVTERYQDTDSLLVVGHGPVYDIAYVLAFCSFMEMQWIHATPIIGAEFFHGPFEIVDGSFPVIILIGEDPTRPQGLRVKEFSENHTDESVVFDSQEYAMNGIAKGLRGFFAPVVLDAATRRFMDYFAAIRGHDKSKRRYMGVVNY